MRRPASALMAAVVLAGCGLQDPYPLPAEPPGDASFQAVAIGETVTEAVLFIEARTGTRVEILSAEAIGPLDGATVELSASTMSEDEQGDIIVGDEHVELAGLKVNDFVDPRADPPANTVAIVAEVTANEPGRYVLSSLQLTYSINGAPERHGEGMDVVVTVCADDPAPADCDDQPG
jgi:hypothetical protein